MANPGPLSTRFALFTPRLIFLPTPNAVSISAYRALYARLHGDASFCEMAFGHHLPAAEWSDEDTRHVINTRDIARCWNPKGMGDFAVGLWGEDRGALLDDSKERQLQGHLSDLRIIEGDDFEKSVGDELQHLNGVQWVGYAGVRDATTTSLPAREHGDPPFPPWQEMIELRYGIAPEFWGKGLAKSTAEAIMQWAVAERGVRRFIAETERTNTRSGRVLQKMGFKLSGTEYFKEPSEVEWERWVS